MSEAPTVLSVDVFDAAGRDGLLVDAAALAELGCAGVFAATAIVAGETRTALEPSLFERQLEAALRARPAAIRIGALESEALAARLSERLGRPTSIPVVAGMAPAAIVRLVAPSTTVLIVRGGDLGLAPEGEPPSVETVRERAAELLALGARSVLVSGLTAHGRVIDLLDDGAKAQAFSAARLPAPRIAGLAGAHAAALAAHLARGATVPLAVQAAQRYVRLRLERGR